MSSHSIYTVWAALEDDTESVWMIWACDEYSYEGDPDVRDAELAEAKRRQSPGTQFREITVVVDYDAVAERFAQGEIEGEVVPEEKPE